MASTTLAFLAIAVLLLQAPWCAVAQEPPAAGTHHAETREPPAAGTHAEIGTHAEMALTSFERSGGTGATACDGLYHDDTALLVALSAQWYEHGGLCHKHIRITSTENHKSAVAEVVDKCDDHIIATSKAVWEALDLNMNAGKVPISWTHAL